VERDSVENRLSVRKGDHEHFSEGKKNKRVGGSNPTCSTFNIHASRQYSFFLTFISPKGGPTFKYFTSAQYLYMYNGRNKIISIIN
jgi:hypothetical protein